MATHRVSRKYSVRALRRHMTFPKRRQYLPGSAACEPEPFVTSGPFGTRQQPNQLIAQLLLLLATDVFVERLEALQLARAFPTSFRDVPIPVRTTACAKHQVAKG